MSRSSTSSLGFEFLNEPGPHLVCTVCHNAFTDPVLTPCSHTFCRACITRWIRDGPSSRCPTCKSRLSLSDGTLRNDLRLREQIKQLKIECVDPRCTWEGRRGDHATHKAAGCPVRASSRSSWSAWHPNPTSTSDGLITIFVRTYEGANMTFQVTPTQTVRGLKKLIEETRGIPRSDMRMLFGGQQLNDDKSMKECNIRRDSQIQLASRVRGG